MLVYSKTIQSFITKLTSYVREIMTLEMGLEFRSKRFSYNGYTYPLHLVVFEDPKKLGFFNPSFFQIGVNKRFLFETNETLIKNILRHELAHLYTHLLYRDSVQDHGPEYRDVCRRFNWSQDVYSATLDEKILIETKKTSEVVQKVEKLLRLSSSENVHESELAAAKANELILKHNLQVLAHSNTTLEDETYVKVVYEAKRADSKLHALYAILQLFYVNPVISRGMNKHTTLEVIGSLANVEVADYVAKVLSNEFDRLWNLTKTEHGLSGLSAKNNFFKGLQKGYIETINNSRKTPSHHSLGLIKMDLEKRMRLVYPRLRKTALNIGSQNLDAERLGFKQAKNISLNKGVQQNQGLRYLTK